MQNERNEVAAWIAREVLPHERTVRRWLARHYRTSLDVEDVIQEAYCRLAEQQSVAHIASGPAYFFKVAQSVAIDSIRRTKVANARHVTEIDWFDVIDEYPRADRAAEAKQELDRLGGLLSKMPWMCRKVIELRRIHGLSQRETAAELGVSESVVENHISRGLRSVLRALADQDARGFEEDGGSNGRS